MNNTTTFTPNPLLQASPLPSFDQVQPQHIAPAIEQLLAQARAALAAVTEERFPAVWSELSRVLDVATERLSTAWGVVSHLNNVADTPALREAYKAMLEPVTQFWTDLGANEALYAKYKAIAPASLNAEQSSAHAKALRGFVLSGAELRGEAKARFAQIQARLAELSQQFSENVLDATEAFVAYVETGELDGVPTDVLQATAEAAKADGKTGHKLSLKMPCYLPVQQFAKNRALRERLHRAYATRASDLAPAETSKHDNSAVMLELLQLRHEEAALLGYPNYAHLSLVPKMAESPAQVAGFLRDLASKAKPFAEKDLAELRTFAAAELNITDLQAWDMAYAAERLKEARYAYSEQEVKNYFTLPKVLAGLFDVVQTLFGVQLKEDQAPVWNEAVRFFRIEKKAADGTVQLIGQFYLDTEARTGKRGGAWMDDVRCRWLRPDTNALQTPVAHLVCNFASGVNGKPALLTHDDVTTLFHECGHGLHHMLTRVNERDVAGINGVEWDAVELPSQFMENFCWEWATVEKMSAHVDTGATLPRELFNKMLAAKNFQNGLQTLRQMEFSLFDLLLHEQSEFNEHSVMKTLQAVRNEIAVVQPPAFNRMPHSFSHIFAGGYAAGYYSYKWAEVLSADAYAAFEESTSPEQRQAVGERYRQEILEVGGSRSAMASFKAFRGREPQVDALLRHGGMQIA